MGSASGRGVCFVLFGVFFCVFFFGGFFVCVCVCVCVCFFFFLGGGGGGGKSFYDIKNTLSISVMSIQDFTINRL